MNVLSNLTIRAKLMLMLVAPVAGLLYFSIYGITDRWQTSEGMADVQVLSELAVNVSTLVHETQKERGMTAGYLGSKGVKFASELPGQRSQTDQKARTLRAFVAEFDASRFHGEVGSTLRAAMSELDRIADRRRAITAMSISGADAIGYYTNMNARMLDTVAQVAKATDNGDIARELTAYVNFLQSKERAGVERAVLTNTFARDNFSTGMFAKFTTLVNAQDTYNNVFLALATDEAKSAFRSRMGNAVVAEVQGMRDIAMAKAADGNFGVDPNRWFSSITTKINLLKEVENELSDTLNAHAAALQGEARRQLGAFVVLALVAMGISVVLTILMIRAINGPLNNALVALKDIAEGEGDLTRRLNVNGRDEIAQLARAFNQFTEKIELVVIRITEAAGAINLSSREISTGNTDLSQRTEEQASSLEETASSMEEMTATVKQNADNAIQAKELVGQARDLAEKGGAVVNDTVVAMGEINEFSGKIGDIIGVIDEIAFQTNLLALNAAVEAARAGEAGRGFAVVASEVRNLAQRSSGAAKEISNLIKTSVEKVKAGSALVDNSGKALKEIVESVGKVTSIVTEIAGASQEQSTGIDQVGAAIRQMDDMTQQNAALVEESSASSEAMTEQAEHLAELMAQFKVNGGNTQGVAQPRSTPVHRAGAGADTTSAVSKPARRASRKRAAAPVTDGGKTADRQSEEEEMMDF